MTYLEAVALLHDIESKYDVMTIKYKGISVWSFLRLRLLDSVSLAKEVKISKSVVSIILRSLFYGSVFQFHKAYDLWNFTSAERRKLVGEKYIHRISGAISHLPYKALMVEKPSSIWGHYPKNRIEEQNILSESWLLVLNRIFLRLSTIKREDLENFALMEKILEDNNLQFDYLHYVRHLVAQYRSMNLFLSMHKKPRIVLFECPYDSMGYLWAFHKYGIKTIELQHGVLNKNHNAYNAKEYDEMLNPDSICVFGVEEFNYLKNDASCLTGDVEMTGLYMLERAEVFFSDDVFKEERKLYKNVVVVSGQAGFEDQLARYVDSVSNQCPDSLFLYIPRDSNVVLSFMSENVRLIKNVNIYQYLKWADAHVTISSTTSLEAHYFRTPTIFYDYQEMATSYYGHILKEVNSVRYLKSEVGFREALDSLLFSNFEYKEIFVRNHEERLCNVIKTHLI